MHKWKLLTTRVEQHSTKVRESYARFLMVVLSAYQQMRNQKQPVLSEVGEDNFDRAFKFFKPGASLAPSCPIPLFPAFSLSSSKARNSNSCFTGQSFRDMPMQPRLSPKRSSPRPSTS